MKRAWRHLLLASGWFIAALASPSQPGAGIWPIDDFTPLFKEPGQGGKVGEAWYKLSFYAPTSMAKEALKTLLGADDPDLERKRQLALDAWSRLTRQYLREIAARYQQAGFAPPSLSPILEQEGRKTYAVYVVDPAELPPGLRASFDQGSRGYQQTGCGPFPFLDKKMVLARTSFGVDHERPSPDGLTGLFEGLPYGDKLLELFRYEVPHDIRNEQDFFFLLAHELFHAVQNTHQARYGWEGLCHAEFDTHRWITEGTASAVGHYLAAQKFPDYMQHSFGRRQGVRNYATPLNSERPKQKYWEVESKFDQEVYRTSSFWRYVIERAGSLEVMARLLETRQTDNSRAGRVKWLDAFIKKEFTPFGLYHFWPEFITEYASYGGFRYRRSADGRGATDIGDATQLNRHWLLDSYLACSEIALTPEHPEATVYLSAMEGISASCVHVEWSGFKDLVKPRAEMIGPDLAVIDQLHVGTAFFHDKKADRIWTCYQNRGIENSPKPWCNAKVLTTTGPEVGTYTRSYGVDFLTFTGNGEATFIVSNVAVEPWNTRNTFTPNPNREDEAKFRFGLDQTEGAALYGPPLPANEQGPGTLRTPPTKTPGAKSLVGMTVEKYDEPTPTRDTKPRFNYHLVPHQRVETPFGYTGPFYGDVVRTRLDGSENLPTGSGVCRAQGLLDREEAIGEVLESSEERLRVKVAADLCRCKTLKMEDCSVVDRFEGTLSLTGGWRYHDDTAPRKIPTRGQRLNDARYDQNLGYLISAALGGDPRTRPHPWSPGDPEPAFTQDGNPTVSGGAGETGTAGGVPLGSCSCTCEERQHFLEMLEEDAEEIDLTRAVVCANECWAEYGACDTQSADHGRF